MEYLERLREIREVMRKIGRTDRVQQLDEQIAANERALEKVKRIAKEKKG